MRFDGFYVKKHINNFVYVADFVLTYSLSYTRYSIIDPYDKTHNARTTRVAIKHDTLNENNVACQDCLYAPSQSTPFPV